MIRGPESLALPDQMDNTAPVRSNAIQPPTPRASLAALVLACGLCMPAGAQSTSAGATDGASGSAKSRQTSPTVTDSATLGAFRLPLLREGSVLARVVGDLTLDPDEKVWLFRPLKPDPSGLRRELVLLPCATLEDMLRAVRNAPGPVEFELTGRVFVYRGRNFLLPELAPAILQLSSPGNAKPTDGATEAKSVVDPGADADDVAVEDIERRLEERIGRVPTSALPNAPAPDADQAPIVASGTRVVLRRGRLSRDPQAGSWRFVPEQTTGSGDPSLELLPCALLERLEKDARQNDTPPIVLLSGSVTAFAGRSYMLPTTYRRAREGRGLSQ